MKVDFFNTLPCDGLIEPNMIYNRCDLWAAKSCLIKVLEGKKYYHLMAAFSNKECYLGIWLMNIPKRILIGVEKAIFRSYPFVSTIRYEYALVKTGLSFPKNHFRIALPDNEEDLKARLSKKGRYNIKREKEILIKTFGAYQVKEYTSESCPSDIINLYFKFKEATHHIDYHLSAVEYLKLYHVSHVYVLYVGEIIGAILLSCEQCPIVYVENLTYDLQYSKYSCGQILYDIYLTKLIMKGYKELFLAGGDLAYKKRYGSIEEAIYNGIVFRSKLAEVFYAMREFVHRKIKPLLKKY